MRPVLFVCGDLCNLGDLALLLQNLELAGGRRSLVRRWAPLPPAIESQVADAGGSLLDGRRLLQFLLTAARSDVVIGGGQLVRGNISLRSLAYLAAGCLVSRICGGVVQTRGLGVSKIQDPVRRLLWRTVLQSADSIRVRDLASRANAEELAPGATVALTADMAFIPSRLHAAARETANDRRYVLIAPCIDASEGRSIDGPGFPALLAATRTALPSSEITFVSHDPRPGMDAHAADLLMRRHHLTAPKYEGYDLERLLEHYRSAALVITNRLHSVIFTLLVGRPLLIIDDGTGKTRAMAERFNVATISMARENDVDRAVSEALNYDEAGRTAALADMADRARQNLRGAGR